MTIQGSTVSEVGGLGTTTTRDRAAFLTHLLNLRPPLEDSPNWLQAIRDRATAQLQELAIPSTRDEEWRFTDLSPLLKTNFHVKTDLRPFSTSTTDIRTQSLSTIEPFILPEAKNSRIVLLDGEFSPELSNLSGSPEGLSFGDLGGARLIESLHDELAGYFEKQPGAEEVFTTLNTACLTNAIVLVASKNYSDAQPIHLLFISTAAKLATVSHPRYLVIAETGSKLTLIEDYVTLNDGAYFTNAVTEIQIHDNAEVNHTRIQRESTRAFHIGKTAVLQAQHSRYTCNAVSLGAQLSRHNLEVYQTGEQTETTLNGLTMIAGQQVADTHSLISFTKPHSTSNQLHKCIVDDRAHAVFNGRVVVPQAAQLTDAKQLSKNLLLSAKARVDTKPQLEITANNVKCTHGATVSQLDHDEVFYLQSRGINADSARQLLVYAFAYDVIRQIPVESLQTQLSAIARIHL